MSIMFNSNIYNLKNSTIYISSPSFSHVYTFLFITEFGEGHRRCYLPVESVFCYLDNRFSPLVICLLVNLQCLTTYWSLKKKWVWGGTGGGKFCTVKCFPSFWLEAQINLRVLHIFNIQPHAQILPIDSYLRIKAKLQWP